MKRVYLKDQGKNTKLKVSVNIYAAENLHAKTNNSFSQNCMYSRHIESFNLNYRKIKPLWLTSYSTSSTKYNLFTNIINNYNSEIKTYLYKILWLNECYQCTVWSISSKMNSRHFGNMFNLRGIWRLQQPDLETKFTRI